MNVWMRSVGPNTFDVYLGLPARVLLELIEKCAPCRQRFLELACKRLFVRVCFRAGR